jgi:hypothetical protein
MHLPMILVIYVHRVTQLGQVEGFNVLKNPWAGMTSIKQLQPVPVISPQSCFVREKDCSQVWWIAAFQQVFFNVEKPKTHEGGCDVPRIRV